jgi:hypothetical protein
MIAAQEILSTKTITRTTLVETCNTCITLDQILFTDNRLRLHILRQPSINSRSGRHQNVPEVVQSQRILLRRGPSRFGPRGLLQLARDLRPRPQSEFFGRS